MVEFKYFVIKSLQPLLSWKPFFEGWFSVFTSLSTFEM